MEPAQIIIILAAIVLTLMALKYVTKILFRLILVLIVMIIFYMAINTFLVLIFLTIKQYLSQRKYSKMLMLC